MASATPDLPELVGSIYDSALDPDGWQSTLDHLIDQFSAEMGVVAFMDNHDPDDSRVLTVNLDPARVESYRTHLYKHDLRLRYLYHQPEGFLNASHRFYTDEELLRLPFYQEYMRHQRMFFSAGGSLRKTARQLVYFSLQRPRKRGPFEDDAMSVLGSVVPHLMRVVRLNERLMLNRMEHWAAAAVLDQLAFGVLLLDERGSLVHANRQAEAMLRAQDGLRVRGGRLALSEPAEHEHWMGLLRATAHGEMWRLGQSWGLRVSRRHSVHPLHLSLLPVRPDDPTPYGGRRRVRVVAFLTDPALQQTVPTQPLETLFDLTPAEARVTAALAEGMSLDELSQHSGLSKQTLRSQLKAVFGKTQTRRQTELIRLVLTSHVGLNAPEGSPPV